MPAGHCIMSMQNCRQSDKFQFVEQANGDPYGTRTRISSLRGWRPNRLDEGTLWRYGSDSNRHITVLQTALLPT